jgi:predicted nuclease of restriction endonuclease-like (RecB) superfamily
MGLSETFPDNQILYTVCTELSWSHLRLLIYIDDLLKREFYIEIGKLEGWSVRQMEEHINSRLFERSPYLANPKTPFATI